MRIWDVEIWAVASKKDPDYWEEWATVTVAADTIQEAIQKALEDMKEFEFFKVEARDVELVREVDVE